MKEETNRKPKIGSVWKHKNGNEYIVILYANEESLNETDYPVTIIYENTKVHSVWCRRLSDWYRSMTEIVQ